jgi:phosphohistidine phosphatase
LSPQGHREASAVAAFLASRPEPPAHVLCSSARRTVETLERVVARLPAPPTVVVSDDLYLASAWKLFERVRAVEPPFAASLLVIAHNPGIAELAVRLASQGDPAALRSVSMRFHPASLAELELQGEAFRDAEPDTGTLVGHYLA